MTSRDPRAVLREAGLRPKRSLGQNFLVASPIASAIAIACVPDDEIDRARVVEIGAGTGALTVWLARRARSVAAIERDRDLVPLLEREIVAVGRTRVVQADVHSVDLAGLLGSADPDAPRVLCGNLPYALTGLLLRRTVEHATQLERAVFMVQREVADRLMAAPGTKAWGALSVFVRAAYDVRRLMRVAPGAFHPSPEVDSTVVEFVPARPPRGRETPCFVTLVHRAFGTRRKTLRNAWAGLAADGAALEDAAARAGISLDARGETLDVASFVQMAEALGDLGPMR